MKDLICNRPLDLLQYYRNEEPEKVYQVTLAILEQFKKLVEDNYMWRIFTRKDRMPDETDWQFYLFSIADTYIKASQVDIDLNRESNSGVGALDFKLSRGTHGKTIVEIKRSSHPDLLQGYFTQLPTYMKADSSDFGLFIIIRENEKYDIAIQTVFDRKKQFEEEKGIKLPRIIVVDATSKMSASKQTIH